MLTKNREIQNFYHTLSHELKTPLTSAREFVSIVMEGSAGRYATPTQTEYLTIARESCDQIRLCLNDLLDASRLETGKLSLQKKPGSLSQLVRRVTASHQPAAGKRLIELQCEVPEDPPGPASMKGASTQVLSNLLSNAFKFTPPEGRVTTRIAPARGRPVVPPRYR